jgi:hypothetical protein
MAVSPGAADFRFGDEDEEMPVTVVRLWGA